MKKDDDKIEENILEDLEVVNENEENSTFNNNKIKKLKEELISCKKEKDEYLVGWQRAKADYINLQRELDQTRTNISNSTKERIVLNLIPVLDSFDMAFSNKESWEKVDQNWRKGIEFIFDKFNSSLSDLGVVKINELNTPFDPMFHESINIVETNDIDQNNKIAQVLQPGYKIGNKAIRAARVNVYQHKIEN